MQVSVKSLACKCFTYAALITTIAGMVMLGMTWFGFEVLTPENNSFGGLVSTSSMANRIQAAVLPPYVSDEHYATLPPSTFSYIAVIDAGSSGCRAHVYRFGKIGAADGPLYVLPAHVTFKVKPGLSTFQKNPESAGASLKGLTDFLKVRIAVTHTHTHTHTHTLTRMSPLLRPTYPSRSRPTRPSF